MSQFAFDSFKSKVDAVLKKLKGRASFYSYRRVLYSRFAGSAIVERRRRGRGP